MYINHVFYSVHPMYINQGITAQPFPVLWPAEYITMPVQYLPQKGHTAFFQQYRLLACWQESQSHVPAEGEGLLVQVNLVQGADWGRGCRDRVQQGSQNREEIGKGG